MVPNGQPTVLWEFKIKYFTIGKVDIACRKDGQNLMTWGMFWLFSGSNGLPKGHWGSPKVPNGLPNVPWEAEIKYSIMGWFHYGTTGRCLYESWTKKCMIRGMLLPFEVPPRPHKGPQWIPMDNLVCHEKLGWKCLKKFLEAGGAIDSSYYTHATA